MITNPTEYEETLWEIQSNAPTRTAILLPKSEQIYDIDLNTREISVPTFLSVAKDHVAETIYFKFDRYFDYADLASKTCMIQYKNANGDSYIYPVPYCDIYTFATEGKVIIPWCIQGAATAKAGIVSFSVCWYSVDENHKIAYSLNTLVAQGRVLEGQNPSDMELSSDSIDLSSELLELIQHLEDAYKNDTFTLFWRDV